MTQNERQRFTVLLIILVVIVAGGFLYARFRQQTKIGADTDLGILQNQVVATFKDADGVEMDPTKSEISKLRVAPGTADLAVNYTLEKREDNLNTKMDVQIFSPNEDTPLLSILDKNATGGVLSTKVKNLADGTYDFAVKPLNFLSQIQTNVAYQNSKLNTLTFTNPFLWGDIDIYFGGKGDDKINSADWGALLKAYNTADDRIDYNGDGRVNAIEASILLSNWNKTGTRFVNSAAVTADSTATDSSVSTSTTP